MVSLVSRVVSNIYADPWYHWSTERRPPPLHRRAPSTLHSLINELALARLWMCSITAIALTPYGLHGAFRAHTFCMPRSEFSTECRSECRSACSELSARCPPDLRGPYFRARIGGAPSLGGRQQFPGSFDWPWGCVLLLQAEVN